jgi:hypothetical protein
VAPFTGAIVVGAAVATVAARSSTLTTSIAISDFMGLSFARCLAGRADVTH